MPTPLLREAHVQRTHAARTLLALILALTAAACWGPAPAGFATGTRVLYEINVEEVDPGRRTGLTERTIRVLRGRLDALRDLDVVIRPTGGSIASRS